ncbi:MAG: hypothetical protein DHS20C15_31060 [Planctomycetota bacterium]|nr:MAG: hypothetical protein DHS20C15_31060 [Planctomycetota bacterium]
MFQITELQLDVFRVLWAQEEASAAEVHAALQDDRDLAPTTVATLLTRLEKRGLIEHRSEGRRHIYRALVSEHQVRTEMLSSLTDGVFGGDVTALVSHLLGERSIHPDELASVQALLNRMKKEEEEKTDDA